MPVFFLQTESSSSQIFAGKWKGYYYDETDKRNYNKKQFLSIEFVLNIDSSYSAYSYTNLSDSRAECRLRYEIIDQDSIRLEEVEVLKPANQVDYCLQMMNLRISRSENSNELILSGRWHSSTESCGKGAIFFQKQR